MPGASVQDPAQARGAASPPDGVAAPTAERGPAALREADVLAVLNAVRVDVLARRAALEDAARACDEHLERIDRGIAAVQQLAASAGEGVMGGTGSRPAWEAVGPVAERGVDTEDVDAAPVPSISPSLPARYAILQLLADGRWWRTATLRQMIPGPGATVKSARRALHLDGLIEHNGAATAARRWRITPAGQAVAIPRPVPTADDVLAAMGARGELEDAAPDGRTAKQVAQALMRNTAETRYLLDQLARGPRVTRNRADGVTTYRRAEDA